MKRFFVLLLIGAIITTSVQMPVDAAIITEETIEEIKEESVDEEIVVSSEGMAEVNNPRGSEGVITWDCVYFGNYWQNDTNNDGYANTYDDKEKIKWRVLAVNGNDAFLLSEKSLDCKKYNTSLSEVTWKNCTLRSWLNGYASSENAEQEDYSESSNNFLNTAFSSSEEASIIQTNLVNADHPEYGTEGGDNTSDKVFLLSYDDVVNSAYGFSTIDTEYDEARYVKNTAFAEGRGAWTYTVDGKAGNGWWSLRTPGSGNYDAINVGSKGDVYLRGGSVNINDGGIRPALHLDLSSSDWSYAGTYKAYGNIIDPTPTNPSQQGHVEKELKPSATEYVLNLATKEKYSLSELAKTKADGKNFKISYASKADAKYASMTAKGIISAKKEGTSNITLKKGDVEYKITVNVYNPRFIYSNPKQKYFTVKIGQTIKPAYEDYNLKSRFELDKSSIKKGRATINADTGELTPLKKGKVKVTAIVGEGKRVHKVTTTVRIY